MEHIHVGFRRYPSRIMIVLHHPSFIEEYATVFMHGSAHAVVWWIYRTFTVFIILYFYLALRHSPSLVRGLVFRCGPRIWNILRLKKMTFKWQGRGKTEGSHLVWHKSEPHCRDAQVRVSPSKRYSNHRLISWRSGSQKTQFPTSLMTTSVRKASFTISFVCVVATQT